MGGFIVWIGDWVYSDGICLIRFTCLSEELLPLDIVQE